MSKVNVASPSSRPTARITNYNSSPLLTEKMGGEGFEPPTLSV
jgi:hypothetical protein